MAKRTSPNTPLEELFNNRRRLLENGCWQWTGKISPRGYGFLSYQGQRKAVHRLAYEYYIGPIPQGLVVRHLVCDFPACFNPEHLAIGTQADNMADMVRKGRSAKGEHHSQAKLTDADAAQLVADYESKEWTRNQLATRYGVSYSAVHKITTGLRRV